MVVAIASVHLQHGFFAPQGYEFPLLLGVGTLTLALQGAGAFALDNLVWKRRLGASNEAFQRAA